MGATLPEPGSVAQGVEDPADSNDMTDILAPQPSAAVDAYWVGTGHDRDPDAAAAGDRAAAAASAGRVPGLLLVFASVDYDLPALADAVRAHAGTGTVIAGCSSYGQFGGGSASDPGVVVLALGPGFEVHPRVARDASRQRRESGERVAAAAADLVGSERLLMLLCDGLTGQQHEIVRGAYSVVGAAVPLVGGCAADNLDYVQTYQLYGDANGVEVLSDAVIALAIGAVRPFFGLGIEHGWAKVGEAMVVSASADGRVMELDGRPALDVYLERTGIDPALVGDEHAFRNAVFSWPLGLSRRSGEDIRVIHAADDDGALLCLADVPQGAIAWVMRGGSQQLIDGGIASARAAIAQLGSTDPAALLIFDCGARKALLGPDGVGEEVEAITTVAGAVPVLGFYTMGEIARITGSRGMHHLTCVTLALG